MLFALFLPEQLEDEPALFAEGRYLRNHEQFQPLGTNVNFIAGINPTSLMPSNL
jgi:diaminopimelate epimerase